MTDKNSLDAAELPGAVWRKSSYSDGGEHCLEAADVRQTHARVAVRDSKTPDGPALMFTPDAFAAFVADAGQDRFSA